MFITNNFILRIGIFDSYSFLLKLREEKNKIGKKLATYRQQVLELLTKWDRSFLPQDAQLNAASPILRLTRSGETAWGPLPGGDWTIFQANHSTYEPLAWAHRDSLDYPANKSPLATVIQVRHPAFSPISFYFACSNQNWNPD